MISDFFDPSQSVQNRRLRNEAEGSWLFQEENPLSVFRPPPGKNNDSG
jgi:hypothetical protein